MRWLIGAVFVGVLVIAGVGWWHVSRPQSQGASAAATPVANEVAVDAAPVRLGAISRQIEAVGSLRSNESVIIRPELAGRVSEILFEEGQRVTRGTPLVRLDSSIARAQVDQQNAAIALSKVNYERAEDLLKKGAGSQRVHDEALAKMRADQATLALAQATLDKMTLLAPFDGLLGLRKISIGDYVNPGQDFVNIESIETLKVDFRISEVYASQLKVGQVINITLDALPGTVFEGAVYAIDPAHDPNGRAVILRARTPNKNGMLRSGMFARVTLIIDEGKERTLVSETAIVPMGQDLFVFLLNDNKVKLTKIKIGQRRAGWVEVLQGLETTSVVITEGALKLRDGMTVKARIEKAD